MPSVSELVAKFERWERKEKKKSCVEDETVTVAPITAPIIPPLPQIGQVAKSTPSHVEESTQNTELEEITPRGRVRYLRDMLETRLKTNTNSTLVPSQKNFHLRKCPTTFYDKREKENSNELPIPYCHLDAYFDEETSAYWTIIDEQMLVYDELQQQFVEPGPDLQPPRYDRVAQKNQQSESETSITTAVTWSTETATPPTSRTEGVLATPRMSESENKDIDATTPRSRMEKLTKDLQKASIMTGVSVPILRKFHMGVQVYALVKRNGGMLKPVILHLAADKGKVYVVRQGKSRFLTIQHFSECDSRSSCLDFMKKDNLSCLMINETVNSLKQQPLMVLWTSTEYTKDCKANLNHKGMAFVFDAKQCRDDFVSTLKAVADLFEHPLKVNTRNDE